MKDRIGRHLSVVEFVTAAVSFQAFMQWEKVALEEVFRLPIFTPHKSLHLAGDRTEQIWVLQVSVARAAGVAGASEGFRLRALM